MQVLCGVLCLDANLTQYSIEVGNALGMNMIKTDIGAPLLVAGCFSIPLCIQRE